MRALCVILICVITDSGLLAQKGRTIGVYCPRPEYPEEARARGIEGSGVILVYVRADGSVASARVLQSSGHAILDRAAKAAFVQWRFVPGSVQNAKLPFTYTVHGIPPGWKFVDEKKR